MSYNIFRPYPDRVNMNIGYKRVSTLDQNTSRQLVDVALDKVFEDKISGKSLNRPELQNLLNFVREGDNVHVHSMDRLARNLEDLLSLVNQLTSKGVSVQFHKENLLFDNTSSTKAMTKLILSIMGAVAEFERMLILERQREGIALAKKRGAYTGRKPIKSNLIEETKKLINDGMSVAQACRETKVSRATYYKYLKANK